MAKNEVVITPEVADILARSTLDGFNFYLPAALGDMYKEVDKVLRLAGACWDRKQPMGSSGIKGAHIVTPDTMTKLGIALENGRIVDAKKLHQQFFTPVAVAENIVTDALAELEADGAFQEAAAMNTLPLMRFMDPSCGDGRFLDALTQWLSGGQTPKQLPPWATVVGIELDQELLPGLRAKGHKFLHIDFLKLVPKLSSLCDYIFMNPPFTNGQDMQHVMHAFRFLKPGGKLIAIVGLQAGLLSSKLHQEFSRFVQAYGSDRMAPQYGSYTTHCVEVLEEGTFKESGTNVATKIIELVHPDF